MTIKYHFKRFLKTIRSTYLCLRYPFLYPRNRWTGKHYNNWKLHQYHVGNYRDAIGSIFVYTLRKSENLKKEDSFAYTFFDKEDTMFGIYNDVKRGEIVMLRNSKAVVRIKVKDLVNSEKYDIKKVLFSKGTESPSIYVFFSDNSDLRENKHFYIYYYTKNYWLRFKIWLADFLNDYILSFFHCIPTFTEWDAMEELRGWNKAFGKQLLKDMKKQLIKDKILYSFRITDLKEKWGTLHLYCNAASNEMYSLLRKYEHISEHTCIECGKPAKYISDGWICPYCEDHIGNRKIYADVDEEGKINYRE